MSFYDYYNIGCFKQKNNNNNMRTEEECTNAGNSEIFVLSHETLLCLTKFNENKPCTAKEK